MTSLLDIELISEWTQNSKCETHAEGRQSCLQAKLTNADSPARKLNCWARTFAQIWDTYSFTVLITRKSDFYRGHPTENYVSLWILGRPTPWKRIITLILITQLAICQMQHNTWQVSHFSASLTALRPTTACWRRNNVQWKCLQSTLLAEPLPTRDFHKVLSRSVSAFSSFMREY